MTNPYSEHGLRYAEARVAFYEDWLRDHKEAQRCQDCEDVVRDVNQLLTDILREDCADHSYFHAGGQYDEQYLTDLRHMSERWLSVARENAGRAARFTAQGFDVAGLAELHDGIAEVSAYLNPSAQLPAALARLADVARAEHARGETTPGLIG